MTSKTIVNLDGNRLTTDSLASSARSAHVRAEVSEQTLKAIDASRELLKSFVDAEQTIYGVNTGVGGFVNWLVPIESAAKLQGNLLRAVATNVGSYVSDDIARGAILARLNSLARGCSAISRENFLKLLAIFNSEIVPCIPEKGSLGASGDLGPLTCIALVATGRWKARLGGETLPGAEALRRAGIAPMHLDFKEGLALINGTSASAAFAALLVEDVRRLISDYEAISAISFEALAARREPFDPVVHQQKPHAGQMHTARRIFDLIADSTMLNDQVLDWSSIHGTQETQSKASGYFVEDAYSIRCTPQILGSVRDTVEYVKKIVDVELNSASDNPLVLSREQKVYHNGHFHGQYLAHAMDFLAISLTTISNLADRRIDRFMDAGNSNGLPAFLCRETPGLRLGLMAGQFTSASLTSENRSLCVPLSVQTLPSTGDFQDIVSLSFVASRRVREILSNLRYIIAFELLCACQAAEIRGAHRLSAASSRLLEFVRSFVPYLDDDTELTEYLESLAEVLRTGALSQAIR